MDTVLITGASRGIGLELSEQFLRDGYRVISTYRLRAPDSFSDLEALGNFSSYELEVTDSKSICRLASAIAGIKIDILINNAGVIGPVSQDLKSIQSDQWLETFAVNSIAPLEVSRALVDNLKESMSPRIISISSQMGSLSRESTGMYAYRSSKAALNKIMQVLALELEDQGIIVCPVHPGWVRTDMGGTNADISAKESASGIIDLVKKLQLKDSGTFFTWEGKQHAW